MLGRIVLDRFGVGRHTNFADGSANRKRSGSIRLFHFGYWILYFGLLMAVGNKLNGKQSTSDIYSVQHSIFRCQTRNKFKYRNLPKWESRFAILDVHANFLANVMTIETLLLHSHCLIGADFPSFTKKVYFATLFGYKARGLVE